MGTLSPSSIRGNDLHLWPRAFFTLVILLGILMHEAFAQFEKTPWPAGQATPTLAFTDLQQKIWTPGELKGRVVVLNFWATWCEPCKEELPSLDALAQLEGNEKIIVLGVNVNEPAPRALKYLKTHGLNLITLSDPESSWARQFKVRVFPTTILIDPKGRARYRVMGAVDWTSQEARQWLESLY